MQVKVKDLVARVEAVRNFLFAIEEVQEGRTVLAVKLLRPLTGLSFQELYMAIDVARGEAPQDAVSEEAREVGVILKKFL